MASELLPYTDRAAASREVALVQTMERKEHDDERLGRQGQGKSKRSQGQREAGGGWETNDPDMVAEGRADEAKGKGQGVVGKVKGAVEDLKDKVKKD